MDAVGKGRTTMTPTLLGRWQTRVFLFTLWGIPITILFGLAFGGKRFTMLVLLTAFILGISLDMVYTLVQRFRWNRDWPPMFVALTGLLEFVILLVLFFSLGALLATQPEWARFIPRRPNPRLFIFHYLLVWVPMFMMMFGGMHVLSPKWRFHGGQWL